MTRPTITAIVCAFNEAHFLSPCLHSLLCQTRPPDEIIVVDNASTDETAAVARTIPRVRVLNEPTRGLVAAREAARRAASGQILAYVDADCRVPLQWLERIERRFSRREAVVALSGPYRFYDWDRLGRTLIRVYDWLVAPPTHVLVHYAFGAGAILYGGNFAVRADALLLEVGQQERDVVAEAIDVGMLLGGDVEHAEVDVDVVAGEVSGDLAPHDDVRQVRQLERTLNAVVIGDRDQVHAPALASRYTRSGVLYDSRTKAESGQTCVIPE